MATKTNSQLKGIRLYAIVLLRIAIGWHFLFEGISKLFTPSWSSADYLMLSNWIFKGFFHWIAENPGLLAVADFTVTWGLIIIGISLFIGLFDRIVSIAGMTLLALFWLANPPLTGLDFGLPHEGNYLIIDKNLVEFLGLLILFLFPTGRILGISLFFPQRKNIENQTGNQADTDKDSVTVASAEKSNIDRRAVIKGLSSIPFLGVFGYALLKQKQWESYEEKNLVDAVTGASAKTFNVASLKELKSLVPSAKIKDVEFSRIILGGNLLSGYTHSRDLIYVSQLVKAYHQKEKIFATLLLAEKCGINTLLTNPILCSLIDEYWKRGIGKIQFISDCSGLNYDDKGASPMPFNEYLDKVKKAIDTGAVACYIQGETADYYMGNGQADVIEKVLDFIKQNGLITGIGAHKIETIKACVDIGFVPDFWMKTLHHHDYWSAGHPVEHDNMFCYKTDETIAYMKTLPQPFIAFKVMAAGAILPKDGFRFAFENGADFICAGMYDFQMVEDVNIACDILKSDIKRERQWYA
ncbi:MAG TPA: DoxX family protein [Bacteroidales bacterium]|nr:DoxX family protein [Bacteroidales bacterium]